MRFRLFKRASYISIVLNYLSWENRMCHTRTTRRTHPINAGNFRRYFSMANSVFVEPFLKFRPGPGLGRTRARPGSGASLFLSCLLVPPRDKISRSGEPPTYGRVSGHVSCHVSFHISGHVSGNISSLVLKRHVNHAPP